MKPHMQLNDGRDIPQVGLGLWQVAENDVFDKAVGAALEAGYTHFDSAQFYRNEGLLGDFLTSHGVKRDGVFITTKISVDNITFGKTRKSALGSLEKLKTDYIDLLLLHFPVPIARKKAWLELEKLQAEGKVRSIGVSNYTKKHLEDMRAYANVVPSVNQVEMHVFLQQPELLEYCHERGIVVEAYSPLAHGKRMESVVVSEVAKKHGKTDAQVMLRWLTQRGVVILPKSVTPARIRENIALFDFELDADDMQKLATCDQNLRTCWDPTLVP